MKCRTVHVILRCSLTATRVTRYENHARHAAQCSRIHRRSVWGQYFRGNQWRIQGAGGVAAPIDLTNFYINVKSNPRMHQNPPFSGKKSFFFWGGAQPPPRPLPLDRPPPLWNSGSATGGNGSFVRKKTNISVRVLGKGQAGIEFGAFLQRNLHGWHLMTTKWQYWLTDWFDSTVLTWIQQTASARILMIARKFLNAQIGEAGAPNLPLPARLRVRNWYHYYIEKNCIQCI